MVPTMASFSPAETERQWDYELLQDGAVSSFHDEKQLDHVVSELVSLGYGVAQIRGGNGTSLLGKLLSQVTMRYGGWSVQNLDAFCDVLRYIDFTGVTGCALVLRQFDEPFGADPQWTVAMANTIAQVSYEHLLMGNRLLALLHCQDEDVTLGRLGGHEHSWR
ncbi:hypothetical protein PSN13_02799 [Micromonospora saelicesensis]|uniref:Barstar (Barnase inhibitor) n=2 Tax=Micromonospora saelicesensis TaxID=285676 RepID=A0A328NT26_9ACTN|nr:hypothetical protein PSN13_02799 [Micromonospora saelicesensis]